MKRLNLSITIIFVTAILMMAAVSTVFAAPEQPITVSGAEDEFMVYLPALSNGSSNTTSQEPVKEEDPFDAFVNEVSNGNAEEVVGAYADETFAFPVVQQPEDNSGWISSVPETVTQFDAANSFGTTGLLAHNTHAGAKFYDLSVGQEIAIVYGDGQVKRYIVEAIRQFQALEPTNPYSDFIDLETNEQLTATDLFYQVYTGDHHVTFQTCLAYDGDNSWGRTFIIATPLN